MCDIKNSLQELGSKTQQTMEAVKSARNRLKTFPKLLAECSTAAAAYAKCVSQSDDPKHHQCQKEFLAFKECLASAAKKSGTRI